VKPFYFHREYRYERTRKNQPVVNRISFVDCRAYISFALRARPPAVPTNLQTAADDSRPRRFRYDRLTVDGAPHEIGRGKRARAVTGPRIEKLIPGAFGETGRGRPFARRDRSGGSQNVRSVGSVYR